MRSVNDIFGGRYPFWQIYIFFGRYISFLAEGYLFEKHHCATVRNVDVQDSLCNWIVYKLTSYPDSCKVTS